MKYTEEEKEVLKTILENKERILNIDISSEAKRTLKIIIDIIEKQQKEIERQVSLIKSNVEYINKLEQDLFENASNYVVSKEKIRSKMEEYAGLKEIDIEAYNEQIRPLEELLGE